MLYNLTYFCYYYYYYCFLTWTHTNPIEKLNERNLPLLTFGIASVLLSVFPYSYIGIVYGKVRKYRLESQNNLNIFFPSTTGISGWTCYSESRCSFLLCLTHSNLMDLFYS